MSGMQRRVEPGPGQESVWDYPRPPRLERVTERLRVIVAGTAIADTTSGWRVLETSHPPTYYLPPDDLRLDLFFQAPGSSFCEFKGVARYWTIAVAGRRIERAGWSYADPTASFLGIMDHVAFYASRVDECWVGDERVQAQAGDFYGGWVTSRVTGPFKGGYGTTGW